MMRPTNMSKLLKLPIRLPKWKETKGGVREEVLSLIEKRKKKESSCCSSSWCLPPKGCVVVYVGEEMARYVIPANYFGSSEFVPVMERVREEYGFDQIGGLRIPCDVGEFEEIIQGMEESGGGGGRKLTPEMMKMEKSSSLYS